MSVPSASRAAVVAFRATAHHLADRLPRRRWAAALDVGAQNSPPGSGPLALAARVAGVDDGTWTAERVGSRRLVVSWSLRGAPFGYRVADRKLFTWGALPDDEASWRTLLGWTKRQEADAGLAASEAAALVAGGVAALLAAGPMTKADLSTALRDQLPERLLPWCRACAVHHVSEQVLRTAALLGGFVFGEDAGEAFRLVRADAWLAGKAEAGAGGAAGGGGGGGGDRSVTWSPPTASPVAAARRKLVRRFLAAYGPADGALLAGWLGVSPADGNRRMTEAEAAGELVAVTVTTPSGKANRWVHVEDVERFRALSPADARGVRLLPPGDPYLQQRDREVIAPDREQQRQIWKALGGPGVVLVDGVAAGTWRAAKRGDALTLTVTPLGRLRAADVAAVEAEAATVARVRGTGRLEVVITS